MLEHNQGGAAYRRLAVLPTVDRALIDVESLAELALALAEGLAGASDLFRGVHTRIMHNTLPKSTDKPLDNRNAPCMNAFDADLEGHMVALIIAVLLVVTSLLLHMTACEMHVEAVDNTQDKEDREKWRGPFYRYCKFMSWPLRGGSSNAV